MTNDEGKAERERRKRNIVLALVLGAIVILFYLMSVVKFHGSIGH